MKKEFFEVDVVDPPPNTIPTATRNDDVDFQERKYGAFT
jgi:hypothetical protein